MVLPGLDTVLDDPSWALLEESHPQFGLKHLLARVGIERDAVAPWPAATRDAPTPRERLVSECMRPAKTTDRWTQEGGPLRDLPRTAVEGLTRLDCAGPREEAETVAVLMRDAVQTGGRTCALVTPDPETESIDLTLKINLNDLSRIIASFERHNYHVKEHYHHTEFKDDLKSRYDQLMSFLNI